MANVLKTEKEGQEVLDQVILGIAHELNNPNTFIRVNAANLKKLFWMLRPMLDEYEKAHPDTKIGSYTLPVAQSKISQMLESILGASVRIIVIADKLKQCASDSMEQSAPVSIREVVMTTIQSHQFLLESCTNLDFVFDPDDEMTIPGYRLQLEQAFSIILTNACDAINERFKEDPKDHSHLQISLSQEDGDVVLRVKDDGCGMDKETLNKAFTPYFTTKPQGVGDGLGLSMCQSIINRHGGYVRLKSKSNQGTEVIIRLPAEE